MKTIIFCEGTTDLLMIQFVLQYKYDWKYQGFVENSVSNRLLKRTLEKEGNIVEICSCGGMTNIPNEVFKLKDKLELATKSEELYDKVIIMIDHDTIDSNREFLEKLNEKLTTQFEEEHINSDINWLIDNNILGCLQIKLFVKCIPEGETGAIETILLEALGTDDIEKELILNSKEFIEKIAVKQNRYLQKKSRVCKAVFNTYFAIRTPEEKYDERARVLKAYNWKENAVLNQGFDFLNI
ncbi:MAG: hypothetical protein IJO85_03225 [Lachnospiraceae bacterium]|nr:hypothetical protein [Lachnospiraceae bacterium]